MRTAVALLSALFVAGCGAAGADAPVREATAARGDVAAELAGALPPGANRCVVVRPGLLPERRRAVFLRLSTSDPIPWARGAPISAWAAAVRVDPDGRRSMVALARLTESRERARRWLEERSPRRIQWAGEPSGDDPAEPAYRARFVDHRTLRLQRGEWPVAPGEGAGAEERCARLAVAYPHAVEVGSRHGEVMVLGLQPHVPRVTEAIIVADRRHLDITRRVTMASPEQARERHAELRVTDGGDWSSVGGELLFDRVDHERRGRVLVSRMRVLWEDLVLAAADQRRMAAAVAEDRRRHRPQAPERIDVENLAAVAHQVALWSQSVDAARGAARRAKAAQLRSLLERVVSVHPGELAYARRLARVLIDELDEGRAAAEVVDRVLSRNPSDERSWRVLRREALAAVGPEPLERALQRDEVVEGAGAARAARDLAALRGDGVDYEFAEGAWVAAQAIDERAERLRLSDVTPTSFPLDSFTETLAELSTLVARGAGPRAMYILATGDRSSHRVMWHPEEAPVVEVSVADDARRIVGVASTGDPRIRAMGRSLFDSLLLGDIELAVYVVPLGGSLDEPEVALRLAGTLETDRFVLKRASGPASRADWTEVARLLGEPLHDMEPERVFPPPELTLELRTDAEAARLLELASDQGALECTRAELRVRCSTHPESPRAPIQVLRRFAAEHLRRTLRLLRQ